MPAKKHRNPFYVLLVIAGIAFAVTAFAYGFMAFQVVNSLAAEAGRHERHPLFQWLRLHGDAALLIELAVLAVFTVAAIATDRWWDAAERDDEQFDRLSRGE